MGHAYAPIESLDKGDFYLKLAWVGKIDGFRADSSANFERIVEKFADEDAKSRDFNDPMGFEEVYRNEPEIKVYKIDSGSSHLPCSLINSTSLSTASENGISFCTQAFPT